MHLFDLELGHSNKRMIDITYIYTARRSELMALLQLNLQAVSLRSNVETY